MAKEGGRRVWESQLSKTLEFLKSLPTRFPISHSEPLQEIMYVLFYHPEAEVSSHRLRCCKCCPEKHAVWAGRQQIPFYPLQLLHMLKFLKEKAVVTSSDARTGNLSPSSHCHRYSLLPILPHFKQHDCAAVHLVCMDYKFLRNILFSASLWRIPYETVQSSRCK